MKHILFSLLFIFLPLIINAQEAVDIEGVSYYQKDGGIVHDDNFIYQLNDYNTFTTEWGCEMGTGPTVYSCEIIGLYQDGDSLRIPEYIRLQVHGYYGDDDVWIKPYLVTGMRSGALKGSKAKSIVLPSYMCMFQGEPFSECIELRDLYFTNRIPANMDISFSVFDEIKNHCTIHVPKGRENAYLGLDCMDGFSSVVSWEGDFHDEKLCYCIQRNIIIDEESGEITQQDEIEVWGLYGNQEDIDLSVFIPEEVIFNNKTYRVSSIGDYAFANTNLAFLEAPKTIDYVGANSFSRTKIKEFVWWWTINYSKWGVTCIGTAHKNKFGGALNRGINQGTFAGSDIETVYLMSPKYMYSDAFANCKNLKHLYIYDEMGYSVSFRPSESFNKDAFSGTETEECVLHIPTKALSQYIYSSSFWLVTFKDIVGWETENDSIVNEFETLYVPTITTKTSSSNSVDFYSIDGIRSSVPVRGINIVRMGDGSTRKIFVR